MRLIDADKLYPDSVSIKGNRLCISQSQIANAPTVDVLDKIRAEIESLQNANPSYWYSGDMVDREEVIEIIDKYRESEDT
jgi:hypothetical protein